MTDKQLHVFVEPHRDGNAVVLKAESEEAAWGVLRGNHRAGGFQYRGTFEELTDEQIPTLYL